LYVEKLVSSKDLAKRIAMALKEMPLHALRAIFKNYKVFEAAVQEKLAR